MDITDKIKNPSDIKKYDLEQLESLAVLLRKKIIEVVSKTGGHLASSLGAVELCIALHYIFDVEKEDVIVWDVGHQAYTHKLLTGRGEKFYTLRQKDGISGFPSRYESKYDPFLVGHGSTAISTALGIAASRKLSDRKGEIIAVVGDGSLQGGVALEALNNVAHLDRKIIVILNDNEMSISPTVGAISRYLNRVITNPIYNRIKEDVEDLFKKIPRFGNTSLKAARKLEESLKNLLVPGIIFEELGFTYLGPTDGHNMRALVDVLKGIQKLDESVVLHLVTKKGKGYEYAEEYPSKFHSAKPFNINSGKYINQTRSYSFTDAFSDKIIELAKENDKIVAITAAMSEGTKLNKFAKVFPDRFFDVGMAEQHAVTFAAGLANDGLIPVVAIYSTFLQRSYDQIVHDICLQNLPVIFALDRSGLVGEDGPTHHGIFDIAYLRHIPNIVILAPKSPEELKHMLAFAINFNSPVAIRFSKGRPVEYRKEFDVFDLDNQIVFPKSEILIEGEKVVILAVGSMVFSALSAADKLKEKDIYPTVINIRFIKPLDEKLLDKIFNKYDFVVTLEEGCRKGGFGSAVNEYYHSRDFRNVKIINKGIPDKFIEHGNHSLLLEDLGLSSNSITDTIRKLWQR